MMMVLWVLLLDYVNNTLPSETNATGFAGLLQYTNGNVNYALGACLLVLAYMVVSTIVFYKTGTYEKAFGYTMAFVTALAGILRGLDLINNWIMGIVLVLFVVGALWLGNGRGK